VKLKETPYGNIGFKLLSVAIAVSLWFFVTYRGHSETTGEAQLEFKNVPQGLEILRQNIKKVTINIRGHESILNGLKPSDIRVVVDLSNGKAGEASYYFDINDVKVTKNIKILRTEPTFVKVTLDESLLRAVQVKPYIVGMPARGYEIKKITVNPAVVSVEGATTEMTRLAALRTEPLDVTGLDADISQNVRVDANGKNVRIKTTDVTVKVVIGRIE
jgi:YbbR domain-containing protein